MSETIEQAFKTAVHQHLAPLEHDLITTLHKLIIYLYPPEVFALCFEVFSDGFTSGFPARAFFMDRSNCEYFIYVNGKANYPSPIDPGLLDIPAVYPYELEAAFAAQDETVDLWDIACTEFILWFAACWDKAKGQTFPRVATIAVHGSDTEFNLLTKTWQPSYAAFDQE
jgi:hypothetical protein